MTDSGYRFCPRCGTALVAGLPFCPRCGLNTAEVGDRPVADIHRQPPVQPPVEDAGEIDLDPFPRSTAASPAVAETPPVRPSSGRGFPAAPLILAVAVIAAGLIVFGLLARPPAGSGPGVVPQGSTSVPGSTAGSGATQPGPTAPIVGITIQSPQDGQSVATGEVTVIGLAPPGLTITRDISFGLDQHATADATGHWAINVKLDQGVNTLVFRIGDDRSTETRLRVTYAPPPTT